MNSKTKLAIILVGIAAMLNSLSIIIIARALAKVGIFL